MRKILKMTFKILHNRCYTLCPFAHPAACCCMLLGVVLQNLKPIKLSATCKRTQQLPAMLRLFHEALAYYRVKVRVIGIA